jgi:transposase
LTTKIAALVDALGNLVRFVLLPGQRHDITSFDVLMAGIACLALIGDKAFDAGWLRERLASGGIEAVIPLREGTTGHAAHDAEKYSGAISSKTSSARSRRFDASPRATKRPTPASPR